MAYFGGISFAIWGVGVVKIIFMESLRHLCPVQLQILRKLHLAEEIVYKLCAGHSQPESQGTQKKCAKIVRAPHLLCRNCAKVVRAQFSHNFGER